MSAHDGPPERDWLPNEYLTWLLERLLLERLLEWAQSGSESLDEVLNEDVCPDP